MFSSENNSYPLFHHQSSSFTNAIIPQSNNTFFQQHYYHHDKINNYSLQLQLPPTFSPLPENNPIVKLPSEPPIEQQNPILNGIISTKRAKGRKDRHTKICTAQGVRDRRVRLSMNIARDFFNLQDMLGFDKASKTLGWLMVKSKVAIDELTKTSNKHINEVTPIEESTSFDAKSLSNKKRNRKEISNPNGRNVAMEMKRREEARNRARVRTWKKKFVVDQSNTNQQSLNQSSVHQQELMVYQSSSSNTTTPSNTSLYGIVSKGVVSSMDDQEICDYNYDYISKSTSESCNYGGFPALNIINLSTEIHINARTWDVYNNQLLH